MPNTLLEIASASICRKARTLSLESTEIKTEGLIDCLKNLSELSILTRYFLSCSSAKRTIVMSPALAFIHNLF